MTKARCRFFEPKDRALVDPQATQRDWLSSENAERDRYFADSGTVFTWEVDGRPVAFGGFVEQDDENFAFCVLSDGAKDDVRLLARCGRAVMDLAHQMGVLSMRTHVENEAQARWVGHLGFQNTGHIDHIGGRTLNVWEWQR